YHQDAFKGTRVLVTGGAGFIGSHLVEALVSLGAEVVALDDLCAGDWANLDGFGDGVKQMTDSILDRDALAEATEGCRYVFHQAALGSVPRSIKEPELYYEVNITGTLNVLQASRAAGVKRVMFAGSSSAYGDPPVDGPKVETMPVLPRSPYAAAKLAGEHSMRTWYHSYGQDTAVLRYFNIFGPRQNPNSAYAAVIAAFAKALNRGGDGIVYGDGLHSRDFTFVANAVHANLLAARCAADTCGEVFNVAMGGRVDLNKLYDRMASFWGRSGAKPTYAAPREGDILHSLADIGRAREVLGYEPIVSFEDGLNLTCGWYRESL
ncbi:MAG: NAD-dependent epimerase/dehydratase family protein, partial [Planctomycetota bacterium]